MNCAICEADAPAIVCERCRRAYLKRGTLLIEVRNVAGGKVTTGKIMVIRDKSFEAVFHREVPDLKMIEVEEGIIERLEEHVRNRLPTNGGV